jgi:ADP-ribosylation factor-binding protein GGA
MAVPNSPAQPRPSTQAITDLFTSGPKSTTPQITSPPPSGGFPQFPTQPSRTPDPFASLASTPRQASPFQYQQSVKPPPPASGAVDLLGGGISAPSTNLAQSTSAVNDDDEWNFASSVPDSSKALTITNTTVNVLFNVSRETDTTILIQSRISNNTPLPISGFTLQVAASKVREAPTTTKGLQLTSRQGATLQLEPQSGVNLGPNQKLGITQNIRVNNVQRGSGNSVKMRWKASYSIGGQQKNEMGEIPSLGVS